jgi:hypothetical protein
MPTTRCSIALAFLLSTGTVACKTSASTQVTQSFRNPGFEDTVFQRVFVVAAGKDQEQRVAFEDAFVGAIEQEQGTAVASWTVLPESTLLTEEKMYYAIQDGSFDAVLVTTLLSVESDRSFTPPQRYNRPRTTFYQAGPVWGMGLGGHWGFYATTFTEVHKPGYFETSKTFRLETNLYSSATNDLVWTGQSETVDPKSVPDLLASMTAAVAKTLRSEGLIP